MDCFLITNEISYIRILSTGALSERVPEQEGQLPQVGGEPAHTRELFSTWEGGGE